ncbi:hypothetical protein evm_014213, partial [Chilo suppressalis]
TESVDQPRRGRGLRGRGAGRHPERIDRLQDPGRAVGRRGSPVARHRDGGRRDDEDHRAQLEDPVQAVADVHHVLGQPAGRHHP